MVGIGTRKIWISLLGSLLLLFGLVASLVSNHFVVSAMGPSIYGYALYAPEENSNEVQAKKRIRSVADIWFWMGIGCTTVGIVLQTIGTLLPDKKWEGSVD